MNQNKIIQKIKFNPIDRISKQKNDFDISKDIDYETSLKNNEIQQPLYFYQKKKVCENNQVADLNKCNNINNVNNAKHYPIPLLNNKKIDFNERDINVDNFIRGQCSRLDTPAFQEKIEQIDDMRLEFLNKNFQDPQKLVLPFPRGGEMTRKKYNKNIKKLVNK